MFVYIHNITHMFYLKNSAYTFFKKLFQTDIDDAIIKIRGLEWDADQRLKLKYKL